MNHCKAPSDFEMSLDSMLNQNTLTSSLCYQLQNPQIIQKTGYMEYLKVMSNHKSMHMEL